VKGVEGRPKKSGACAAGFAGRQFQEIGKALSRVIGQWREVGKPGPADRRRWAFAVLFAGSAHLVQPGSGLVMVNPARKPLFAGLRPTVHLVQLFF
jgi:hypothetical protein